MRRNSLWGYPVFRILLAVLRGVFAVMIGIFLLTGLLLLADVPYSLLRMAADVLWAVGAFAAGQCAGFHARQRGILTGLLCGLFLCGVLLCGCTVLELYSVRITIRCVIILLAAVCGGIIGVNRKIRKPPD